MLDAIELAQIQADLAAACLDKTCVISRSTTTQDIYGNAVKGDYEEIDTVKCAMKQPSAGLLQNYDYRIGSLATWLVRLPYGTSLLEEDHLLIEGQTLTVHVLLDPHTVPGLDSVLAAELK